MPWNKSNYPASFNNLSSKQREKAISIAEAIRSQCVKDGGDESKCSGKAIRIALWRIKNGSENVAKETELAEPTRLSRIVDNFNANVRGIDIAVDVAHDPDRGAAAWIKLLKLEASSADPTKKAIYANVEWTDYGKEIAGKSKQFRYISSEYGKFTDPETGTEYDDVMAAVTLTNRPAIKWMQPVEPVNGWIEILREGDYAYIRGNFPDGKQIIMAQEEKTPLLRKAWEALSALFAETVPEDEVVLPEVTETGQIILAAKTNGEPPSTDHKQIGKQPPTNLAEVNMDEKVIRDLLTAHGVEVEEGADLVAALTDYLAGADEKISDLEEQLAAEPEPEENVEDKAKLQEAKSEMVKLQEANTTLVDRVVTLEQKLSDQERDVFFSKVMSEGRLRPADVPGYKKLYAVDKDTTMALLAEGAVVIDLEEHGSASSEVESVDDALLGKVIKLAETKGISREAALDLLATMESDV